MTKFKDDEFNVLKNEYISMSDNFLYPLLDIPKADDFDIKSYIFWNKFSVEDYYFIVTMSGDEESLKLFLPKLLQIVDKNTPVIEYYKMDERHILIIDMSYWASDIELFLLGKYSKFSKDAKNLIVKYHNIPGRINEIPYHIFAVLFPEKELAKLNNRSSLEYVADIYNLDTDLLYKVGELGRKYDKLGETLLTNIDNLLEE